MTLKGKGGINFLCTEVQERMRAASLEPAHSTPDEFGSLIARDIATWSKVVKAGNIKID